MQDTPSIQNPCEGNRTGSVVMHDSSRETRPGESIDDSQLANRVAHLQKDNKGDNHRHQHSYQTPNTSTFAPDFNNSISGISNANAYLPDSIKEEYIEGKITTVRRMFCLLVTFDVIIIVFLWIVCVQVTHGGTFQQKYIDEILHYCFKKSASDSVLLSFTRAVLLLLAYALFKISHWWMVAITTSVSCSFLLAKSFFIFDDTKSSENLIFEFLLVLAGFILPWVETWFLDFKVFPRERKLRAQALLAKASEQSPLLRGSVVSGAFPHTYSDYGTSTVYYSPVPSEDSSLYSDLAEDSPQDERPGTGGFSKGVTTEEEHRIIDIGKQTLLLAKHLLCDIDGWELQKTVRDELSIMSKGYNNMGKIFRFEGPLSATASQMFKDLFYNIEESPNWNPTVLDSQILKRLDSHTDIQYSVTAPVLGGLIASRDFVNVRHWQMKDGQYISAAKSVDVEFMPTKSEFVRGETRIAIWVLKPDRKIPNKCYFTWIINTDLKGHLLPSLVDRAMTSVLLDFYKHLAARAESLANPRSQRS